MTHQVSLSDQAYKRLRRSRLRGESFSDAVERLLDHQAKDPMRFVERLSNLPRGEPYQERMRRLEQERNATKEPA